MNMDQYGAGVAQSSHLAVRRMLCRALSGLIRQFQTLDLRQPELIALVAVLAAPAARVRATRVQGGEVDVVQLPDLRVLQELTAVEAQEVVEVVRRALEPFIGGQLAQAATAVQA